MVSIEKKLKRMKRHFDDILAGGNKNLTVGSI